MDKEQKVNQLQNQIKQYRHLKNERAPFPKALDTTLGETWDSLIAKLKEELRKLLKDSN